MENIATINPYLNFMGKPEEAFNFFKKVPENDKNKLMHIYLPIGDCNILTATDAWNLWGIS